MTDDKPKVGARARKIQVYGPWGQKLPVQARPGQPGAPAAFLLAAMRAGCRVAGTCVRYVCYVHAAVETATDPSPPPRAGRLCPVAV